MDTQNSARPSAVKQLSDGGEKIPRSPSLVCSVCMEPSRRPGLWPLIVVPIQMDTLVGIITLYIHISNLRQVHVG